MQGAYALLDRNGTIDDNVIVVIGLYTRYTTTSAEDKYWLHEMSSDVYNKEVTITGQYHGENHHGMIPFTGGPASTAGSARYLNANTRFMYIDFDGGTQPYRIRVNGQRIYFYIYQQQANQVYWFLQGYSLIMGKGINMVGYSDSNTNQGLYSANAPAFHIFGGWEQFDQASLPRNNPTIAIKSGAYGRVILGGSNGVSSQASLNHHTSHNFIGSSLSDTFVTSCNIDIRTSTKGSYDYDINLLVGGACTGNTYSNSTLTLDNGSVGRIIGGSIGDSSYRVTNYPVNTYVGSSTLNLNGGSAAQVYGASLGRVMSGSNKCDVYYYGTATINLSGTNVTGDVFGAGAGAVTGYNSTYSASYGDQYGNRYSSGITTKSTINMTSGTVSGSIYGGGYGYTNYLMLGSNAYFGGRQDYFKLHGDYVIYDYNYAINHKWIDKDYFEWWGFEDRKLFKYAKKQLKKISSKDDPFNFTILTADTHFTDGYLDDKCDTPFEQKYLNSYHCSDEMIGDFINWVKEQDFYKNTTIVIVGDHLTMQKNMTSMFDVSNYERSIYNVFINSKVVTKKTKHRMFNSFDIYPTTLRSLGFKIDGDKIGLGTDLFSGKKTLIEKNGFSYVESELKKVSPFYNKYILGDSYSKLIDKEKQSN